MRGHNVNIYFSEKTYNKIKPLIVRRKISSFVNQAVEKELQKQQQKAKEDFKKELIAGYKSTVANKELQKELAAWDELEEEDINHDG